MRLLWMVLLAGCAPVPNVPVESLPATFKSQQLMIDGEALHYVESGTRTEPLVLFVHGTPGSWQAFARFLEDPRLYGKAHLISVDRPGFGQSSAMGSLPAFAEQSQRIGALLSRNDSGRRAIVVGHSLGGALIFRLAIDYPEQVGALMAISAPIDPALSGPRWYNQLARIPGARWLIGQDLGTANDEMLPLAAQLEPIVAQLPSLKIPVTLVHGVEDGLVKIGNADFAQARLTAAPVRYRRYEQDGHFIVWERHDEMVAEIERLLDAPL